MVISRFVISRSTVRSGLRRVARVGLSCALALGVVGCSLGPPPDLDAPSADALTVAGREPVSVPATFGGAPRSATVEPADDLLRDDLAWPDDGRWWRAFDDPVLDALIDEALAGSFALAAASSGIAAAAAAARIAGADRLPRIAAGLDASRRQQVFVGLPIPGTDGVLQSQSSAISSSINVSWEADLWGRVRAGRFAAQADADAAALDYQAARLSIAAQTAKAYFALREAEEQLAIAERTEDNRRRFMKRTENRYRRGVAPPVEVRLARAERARVESDIALRRRLRDEARRRLELLLGRYPGASIMAATDPGSSLLLASPPEAVPSLLPAELVRRRPDLVAAERRLVAAGWRVTEARAALYPRLTLTGSTGTTSDDLGDLLDSDFSVWSLAGGLLAPIFQGGRLRAAVDLGAATREGLLADYVGQVLRAFSEVERALSAAADLVAQEHALAETAEESRRAATLARDRYSAGIAGTSGFLQALEAERTAFRADSQRLAVRHQRLINHIDLFVALGGGFGTP